MPAGLVYRIVDDEHADLIGAALDAGKYFYNAAPAMEGPGHRACMIYSAIVCPYLASPGARRKIETQAGLETLPRGDPRGASGGLAGFDGYSWTVGARGLEIFFGRPVELLRYTEGTDLAGELDAEIAREQATVPSCPAYLLDDDARAEESAKAILTSVDGSQAPAGRQQDQARKERRKSARAARRKNR